MRFEQEDNYQNMWPATMVSGWTQLEPDYFIRSIVRDHIDHQPMRWERPLVDTTHVSETSLIVSQNGLINLKHEIVRSSTKLRKAERSQCWCDCRLD